ncbi:hypothetical protein JTE90_016049 [Oedothorax gibbosus]|uniref:SYO1-like TPR repeats domain-containing protein n=1 Tax=Oedothorax gibbosus TaxID=931172 RepID=A0AAV6U444_9ARAC|nr:hypothetical protein JTE90_016049 [Oedothorax gibbosus]
MGKSKGKKYKAKASNPIGLPSVKEIEMEESEISLDFAAGNVEEIVEKLQSRKAEDRECGAVIIANLSSNTEFIASLIENKVIRVAAPLLVDRNLAVRHSIAGCLRNIAVCGDYLVSEAMVEQDLMTSLVTLLEEYREPWSLTESTEDKIDSKTAIFVEACNLLWSLCENSALAVSIFNQKNLITILLPCLNIHVYGLQVPVVVAQCLHTVGENNEILSEILRQPFAEELMKSLMILPTDQPEKVLLRILAAGIKLNIFVGKLNDCMDDVTTSILDLVSATLDEPSLQITEFLAKQMTILKVEKMSRHHEEKYLEDKFKLISQTRDRLLHILSAKQCALEILGKMFEDDDGDENDEWDDISSNSSADMVTDAAEMEIEETNIPSNDFGPKLPVELLRRVVNGNLLGKVLEQMVLPQDETLQVLSTQSKDCFKKIETIRCTALLCLNNIIQKIDVKDLGGPSKLLDLSNNLSTLLFKKTDFNNTDQVEALTRSMSAVVRKLAEADCSSYFSQMTESDLELLTNVCQQTLDSRIKVHIIRMLGTIGCLLGTRLTPNSYNLIKIIGSVLLDICSKNADMWVTAEALDVIFDVFAEDHIDSIAKEINLVEKLQHILPILKGKIKQQRKTFGENIPVIMTARDNLLRFIKYKIDFAKK